MDYVILTLAVVFLLLIALWAFFMVFMLVRTGVPFVPTSSKVIREMLQATGFQNNQTVYELGCGNGKLMFAMKKKVDKEGFQNIKIRGYELVLPLVWWAKVKYSFMTQTTNEIEIFSRDFFKQDLSDADIIFCYLFPPIMQRISREIWPELKKGTVLISHAFKIDDLEPKEVLKTAGTTIYVYEK